MLETSVMPPVGRSFYSASVREFLKADPSAVLGQLSSRHVAFHQAAEAEQIRAWEREIEILHSSFRDHTSTAVSIVLASYAEYDRFDRVSALRSSRLAVDG